MSGAYHNEESFISSEDGLQKEAVTESKASAENVAMEQGREIDHLIREVQEETGKSAGDEEGEAGGGEESRPSISKEEEEEETSSFVLEEKKEQNESVSEFLIEERIEEDDDEEEEEEGNGTLSTEELNKKFDDFIRRMKEEIRIEAQQQLVMV